MEIKGFFRNRFMDRTTRILSRALDFRSANQQVISSNMANVDTPGFRPKELLFDQELRRAAGKNIASLKTTDSNHFSHSSDVIEGGFSLKTVPQEDGEPGQLNIDAEMAKMTKNNLLYEASSRLLTKKIRALRSAIEGARR